MGEGGPAGGGGLGEGVGGGEGAGDISPTLPYTALPHGASPQRDFAQLQKMAVKVKTRQGSTRNGATLEQFCAAK